MNWRNASWLKSAALWLVGFHFLAVALHSVAHEVLHIKATPAQLAFVVPVIVVAPLASAFVLRKFERAGAWLLLASMAGSFVFGLYYHFVADTIDHVAHVARLEPAFWSKVFHSTAYLLAVSESAGAAVAWSLAAGRSKALKEYAARTAF